MVAWMVVRALQALRGIALAAAATLVTELGDMSKRNGADWLDLSESLIGLRPDWLGIWANVHSRPGRRQQRARSMRPGPAEHNL